MADEKRHKRGDVREDGKVFWSYSKTCAGGEWWLPPEEFSATRSRIANYSAEYNKAYYADNKDRIEEQKREYVNNNREAVVARNAAYYAANREARIQYNVQHARKRRATDPLYALAHRIRCRVSGAFRSGGYSKKSKIAEIVGCSFEDFKTHFESLFTDGMCWERFSEIHIDHIIPVSSATNEEELIALNHYTNLQPLWAKDNLQKSNKVLPVK